MHRFHIVAPSCNVMRIIRYEYLKTVVRHKYIMRFMLKDKIVRINKNVILLYSSLENKVSGHINLCISFSSLCVCEMTR
jgi:hypothetical protein